MTQPIEVDPGLVEDGLCGLSADLSCLDPAAWTEASDAQRLYALDSARRMLNHLTVGQVANCPVISRPCGVSSCEAPIYSAVGISPPWYPRLNDFGRWVNERPCGCRTDCWHADPGSRHRLPSPVTEIVDVLIDGESLDRSEYRLLRPYLVRADGTPWPSDQDLSLPLGEPGTFGVTYRPGFPLGPMGERALGLLVSEFLKACTGDKKCSLPSNVQTISRQGVQFNVERDMLSDGLSGIRDVDMFTSLVNPNRLTVRPQVYVPGARRG